MLLSACHLPPYPISGGGRAGPFKIGSGRSPFVARLRSPQPLTVTTQKRSKSVSPPLLGRISPFTQTVYSNSWSTFYSEESAVSLDPLLPQLCLVRLFEVNESNRWGLRTWHPITIPIWFMMSYSENFMFVFRTGAASTFFSSGSLATAVSSYLYYLTPGSSQLWWVFV